MKPLDPGHDLYEELTYLRSHWSSLSPHDRQIFERAWEHPQTGAGLAWLVKRMVWRVEAKERKQAVAEGREVADIPTVTHLNAEKGQELTEKALIGAVGWELKFLNSVRKQEIYTPKQMRVVRRIIEGHEPPSPSEAVLSG